MWNLGRIVGGPILRDIQHNIPLDSPPHSHSPSHSHTLSHPHLRREAPTYRICMLGCGSKDERERHQETQLSRLSGEHLTGSGVPLVMGVPLGAPRLFPPLPFSPFCCQTSQTWSPPSCTSPSCLLGETENRARRQDIRVWTKASRGIVGAWGPQAAFLEGLWSPGKGHTY